VNRIAELTAADAVEKNREVALAAEAMAHEAYDREHPEPKPIDFPCSGCRPAAQPGSPCEGSRAVHGDGFHRQRMRAWIAAHRPWVVARVTAGDDAYCVALLGQ
jgi:hypothetical protein